jgi:hypothetical protein
VRIEARMDGTIHALSGEIPAHRGVPTSAQTTALESAQSLAPARTGQARRSGASKYFRYFGPRRHARVESRSDRQNAWLIQAKGVNQEGRAKPARPTVAFTQPEASAREFHQKQFASLNRKTLREQRAGQPGCHRALGGLAPTAFAANSVASASGFRSGATPFGHLHLKPVSPKPTSKEDISIWQRRGHFYLASTLLCLPAERGKCSLVVSEIFTAGGVIFPRPVHQPLKIP